MIGHNKLGLGLHHNLIFRAYLMSDCVGFPDTMSLRVKKEATFEDVETLVR